MSALRLWSWQLSPFAGKVRVALAEKGVEVETIEVHPVKRPPRLRELNPTNRVPVLEVDGHALRESSVICEWIEETHPEPPPWPSDPDLRGWARGWARYVDDELTTNYFLGMRKQAFGKDEHDPEDVFARLHGRLPRRLETLEAILGMHDGPWLCGEQFTLADLSAMAPAVRLPAWSPDLAPDPGATPRVAAWMDALRERPSAAAVDAKGYAFTGLGRGDRVGGVVMERAGRRGAAGLPKWRGCRRRVVDEPGRADRCAASRDGRAQAPG